jgi:hypothetical protein
LSIRILLVRPLCKTGYALALSKPRPPMTLGNMRELGAQRLIAYCLNDACRHTALIDVSSYPAETGVPSFRPRIKCGKSGGVYS